MTAIHYPEPEPASAQPVASVAPLAPTGEPTGRRWTAIAAGTLAVLIAAAGALMWATRTPASVVDAAGFAEMYVVTYLTPAGSGAEHELVPYLGFEPELAAMVPGAHYVANAVAMASTSVEDGQRIVVAVDQLHAVAGGFLPDGIRFYEVHVTESGGRLRARALPSPVPAPNPPSNGGGERVVAPWDPAVADAVEEYFAWYMAGADGPYSGDRVEPPLVSSVEVEGWTEPAGDGYTWVTVTGTDTSGVVVVEYPIHLSNDGGRWLVEPAH